MTDINPTAIAEERYPKTSKTTPRTATLLSLRAGQIQGYADCIVERELPLRERVAELEARPLTEAAHGQQPTVGGMLTPFRCPVCGGNGIVAGGFYGQTSGQWLAAEVYSEQCRSCSGTGVVWG